MTHYALYLESGPRQRKTMVHVVDLLGCIAQGATTPEVLEATPEAIRTFLRFLNRHDTQVSPEADISTSIAAHIMEGHWLGNGDPTPGFAPDFQTLTPEDMETYLQRLTWLHADLLDLIRPLSPEKLLAKPEGSGRSIFHILEHMAESQGVYLRYLVGKVPELSEVLKTVKVGPQEIPTALIQLWEITQSRMRATTQEERSQFVAHGQVTWTARRAMRRMLEHDWEHLVEIANRLETPVA